jgi:hypothetical protein
LQFTPLKLASRSDSAYDSIRLSALIAEEAIVGRSLKNKFSISTLLVIPLMVVLCMFLPLAEEIIVGLMRLSSPRISFVP